MALRRMKRFGLVLMATAWAFVWGTQGADASLGTGVGATPIKLAQTAVPGHTYDLPPLFVINTGTEPSYYAVRVERMSEGPGRPVPQSWVRFGRNRFLLAPQESTPVPMTLTIPADAAPGDYLSNLVAGTVPGGDTAGVALGAAAATRLEFSVGQAVGLHIPWPWPLWVYILVAAAFLFTAGVLLMRLLGVRVQVERRRR